MKTTVEIPDKMFRLAKLEATRLGVSLKTLFTEALSEKVRPSGSAVRGRPPAAPPHMKGFGALRSGRKETRRIQKIIDEEFSRIDPGDWK